MTGPSTDLEARPADGVRGAGPPDLQHRLVILMAARLALSLVSLVVALVLDSTVADFTLSERRGFYGTVAFAFLATAITGLVLRRIRHARRFAAINIAMDLAIVSALVYLSGGPDSPFAFLYVLVAVYGAALFERLGALAVALAGAVAYGAVLVAAGRSAAPLTPVEPPAVLLVIWLVHSGAVVLGAALASFLAAELRRTGVELQARSSELESLRRLYQHTFESLMSGLMTTDPTGRLTSFNPEAERITGLCSEGALGRDVEEILPGLRELVSFGTDGGVGPSSRARMPFRRSETEELHLGVAAYILRDGEGASCGHVVIFQDLTKVVEMEDELRRAERMAAVGQLSASLAHEVRNPLAAISGSIQMLQNQLRAIEQSEECQKLMNIALREIDRLDRLIADFLGYARPGALRLAPVDVGAAVDDVLEVFERSRPPGVAVCADLEPRLLVLADSDQLEQVLWNLLLNAAQAMPEGGELRISSAAVPDDTPQERSPEGRRKTEDAEKASWVEMVVADEGVGIAREDLDRIFDPFYTTKRGGSGLGLPTVHRIVGNHGGSVRLESSLGKGTTIRVRLPRAEEAA